VSPRPDGGYHRDDTLGELRANRQRDAGTELGKALDLLAGHLAVAFAAECPHIPTGQAGEALLWAACALRRAERVLGVPPHMLVSLLATAADELLAPSQATDATRDSAS
jgi:hypothetical protein